MVPLPLRIMSQGFTSRQRGRDRECQDWRELWAADREGKRSKLSLEGVTTPSLRPLCPAPFTGTPLSTARPPSVTGLQRETLMLKKEVRAGGRKGQRQQRVPEALPQAHPPQDGPGGWAEAAAQGSEPRTQQAIVRGLGQAKEATQGARAGSAGWPRFPRSCASP